MKRDWELIRTLLTEIEEEKEFLAAVPPEPKWKDQSEADFQSQLADYKAIEGRIFGHLELLVEGGYLDGFKVSRSLSGSFYFSRTQPRLTMAGHDLLATMRSSAVWEKVKSLAKTKSIDLTVDVVKTLAATAVKQIFS